MKLKIFTPKLCVEDLISLRVKKNSPVHNKFSKARPPITSGVLHVIDTSQDLKQLCREMHITWWELEIDTECPGVLESLKVAEDDMTEAMMMLFDDEKPLDVKAVVEILTKNRKSRQTALSGLVLP